VSYSFNNNLWKSVCISWWKWTNYSSITNANVSTIYFTYHVIVADLWVTIISCLRQVSVQAWPIFNICSVLASLSRAIKNMTTSHRMKPCLLYRSGAAQAWMKWEIRHEARKEGSNQPQIPLREVLHFFFQVSIVFVSLEV